MNINKTILDGIESDLSEYYCNYDDVENLLFNEKCFSKKQEIALKIMEKAMEIHRKERLVGPLHELAKIEPGIREAEQWLRDHVVHATLSFFLGIYLNKKLLNNKVNAFQWKLAGMFHDISYSVEIGSILIRSFAEKINKFKNDNNPVSFKIYPENLINLPRGRNALDLIQNCLDKWELKIDVENTFKKMISSHKMNHGIISSLILLNAIDVLYQNPQNRQHYRYFTDDIIPACSAIYIHNPNIDYFNEFHINSKKAPLAFLLRLSDCLQEWERPSLENPEGIPATSFDIKDKDEGLAFIAEIPNKKIEKIKKEIKSTLDKPNIEIIGKSDEKSYKLQVTV